MAIFCARCGKQCSDHDMICPACGQMLSASGIVQPINPTTMNGNVNGVQRNSMQSYTINNTKHTNKMPVIWIVLGCMVLFIGMILITFMVLNSKGPTEKWIKDNLPQDVYLYELNYEEHISTLSDIEIINSYEQADTYYVDFKVLLDEEYICRELVFHYSLAKHGFNDWVILSSEIDEDNSTVNVQLEAVKKCADTYLTNLGYKLSDDMYITSNVDDRDLYCEYNINETYEYFEAEGLVIYDAYLKYGRTSCPQSFILKESLDFSNVDYEWKIAGTWEGDSDGYHVVLEITPEGDNKYSYKGKCYYENIYGELDYYSGEGMLQYENPLVREGGEYYAPENVQAFQSFWIGYPWCFIGFYASDAVMHIGKNTEASPFTRISAETSSIETITEQEIENTTEEKQEITEEMGELFIKYDGVKITIPCTIADVKKKLGDGSEEHVDDDERRYYGLSYDAKLMFFSEVREGQTEDESQPHSIYIETVEGLTKTKTSCGIKGSMTYDKAIATLKKKGITYEIVTYEEQEDRKDIVVYQGVYRLEFVFDGSEMDYICISDTTYQ